MIMELLGHKDYLRILHALQRKPMRFLQIQKTLKLNPAQVDRAIRFLRKGLWIIPRTVPTMRGRIPVEYGLGKRGAAFLESFQTFTAVAFRRKAILGPSAVAELQSLHFQR
jgi:DNA-binding HxlR family transcriptional regulator